jgi:hypothetical protein
MRQRGFDGNKNQGGCVSSAALKREIYCTLSRMR